MLGYRSTLTPSNILDERVQASSEKMFILEELAKQNTYNYLLALKSNILTIELSAFSLIDSYRKKNERHALDYLHSSTGLLA